MHCIVGGAVRSAAASRLRHESGRAGIENNERQKGALRCAALCHGVL